MFPILELERAFHALNPSTRRFARAFPAERDPDGPAVKIQNNDDHVLITLDVPGLSEQDVTVSFERQVLTLTGERTTVPTEGYALVRRERPPLRLSRSIRFGVPIDVDRISAVVKNGVLTVTLPKAARAVRTIPVQALA